MNHSSGCCWPWPPWCSSPVSRWSGRVCITSRGDSGEVRHRECSSSWQRSRARLVVAVSGWIIPSVVVGAIVGWLADSVRRRRGSGDDVGVERTEALASWVENVRDVLQSGNQPVGAIGATTDTCPPSIRPHVRSLFARLSAGQPRRGRLPALRRRHGRAPCRPRRCRSAHRGVTRRGNRRCALRIGGAGPPPSRSPTRSSKPSGRRCAARCGWCRW